MALPLIVERHVSLCLPCCRGTREYPHHQWSFGIWRPPASGEAPASDPWASARQGYVQLAGNVRIGTGYSARRPQPALRRCIAKCSRGHGRGTRLHESRRVHGMSMSLRWPAPATAHGPRSSPIDRSITHRRRVRHEGCREFGPLHTMMVSPLLPAPGVNQTQSGCVGLPKSGA